MPSAEENEQKARNRGLPSIQEARDARSEGRTRWPATKLWGYAALILAVGFILQWKWTDSDVERGRQKLLADQRGVAAELSPRWLPMRDRIEKWTTALAAQSDKSAPDVVDREALGKWDFRARPGIYLRLRVEDATTADAIRKNARDSLRDGFTACLVRAPNTSATAGTECKRTRDCPAHEFCNEQDHCSRPAQPFNLRVAYRTMHILTDEWVRDVQGVDSELRLRLYQKSFEDAIRDDMPLAAEFLTQAQYYLVVLDETPPGMAPPPPLVNAAPIAKAAPPTAPTGPPSTAAWNEAVQGVAHHSRVGVFRLSDDKLLLRVRRDAGGELLGAQPAVDPEVLAARQRQANSCALALAVREAMGDTSAAVVPPQ